MRPVGRVVVPSTIFFPRVATTKTGGGSDFGLTLHSWQSATVRLYRLVDGTYKRMQEARFGRPEAMFQWMRERVRKGKSAWIVTPNATAFLAISRWFEHATTCTSVWSHAQRSADRVEADHSGSSKIVLTGLGGSGRANFVKWRDEYAVWTATSYPNYFGTGDVAGSERCGSKDGTNDHGSTNVADECSKDCQRDCGLEGHFASLLEWWRLNGAGRFGVTIGQLSVNVLRSTVSRSTLCTHGHMEGHTLERQSCFGGRSQTFFFGRGRVGGYRRMRGAPVPVPRETLEHPWTIAHIDVRSMYPTIFRDEQFPVKFIKHVTECSPTDPIDAARSCGVIASVQIETPVPHYPRRTDRGIDYPVGRFVTQLAGPELLKLSTEGRILKCHRMNIYRMGQAFASFAASMLKARKNANCAGRASEESIVKLLSNSLSGKLAQRKGCWVRDSARDCPGKWGEVVSVNAQTGVCVRRRWILGRCERYDSARHPSGPYTAAYSYLTSYGRLWLRRLMEMCPPRTVVSVDTDGLWVAPDAAEALGSHPDLFGDDPGQLRVTGRANDYQFFGPKHYRVDDDWVLSGFSQTPVGECHSDVWDIQHINPIHPPPNGPPVVAVTRSQRKNLPIDASNAIVGTDGWVVPRHVPRGTLAE